MSPASVLREGRLALALVIALWTLGAAAVLVGAVVDVLGRASSPEAPLRAYLAHVAAQDLDAALLEVAPEARPAAVPFVVEQRGNEYRILGLGVRQPSLLDRLTGRGGQDDTALITVQLDIIPMASPPWRTTTHVRVIRQPDGWYLARPPLQPEPDESS